MSNNTLGIEKGDVVRLKDVEVRKVCEYGFYIGGNQSYVDLGYEQEFTFIDNELYDHTISRKPKPNQPLSILSSSQEARDRAEHIVINREDIDKDPAAYIMLRGGEIRPYKDIQFGSIGVSVYPAYQVIWKGHLTDALHNS